MNSNAIQFLSNAATFLSRIFIPNMVKEFGASNLWVGIVLGVYNLMNFISYNIFGRASDIYGRRIFLRIGLFLSAVSFLLQIFAINATNLQTLIIVRALAGFTIGIYPAALIAYVYESKESIGKFSSYGSLGWGVGTFIAGIIAVYQDIFILSSFLFFVGFLISLGMPKASHRRIEVPVFPITLIRQNLRIYLPFFLRYVGAALIWTILPLYLVELGATMLWIGVLYTINTLTQFIVMRRLDKYDNESLIRAGLLLSIVALFAHSIASNPVEMIPVQVLVGLSWSLLYVGSISALTENNIERATVSGILQSLMCLALIFGPVASGMITSVYDFKVTMYLGALLSLLGFLVYVRSEK